MTNRLRVRSLLSIGAVEEGDNPEADILFWKAKTPEPPEGQVTKEGSVPFDIESLDGEAKAFVEGLQAQIAELTNEEPPALPEDLPAVVKTRLDSQDEALAKEREKSETLAKDLAEMREERDTERYQKLAEGVPLIGPADEVAPLMQELGGAAPEAFDKFYERLAPFKTIGAFETLLKEHGDSSVEGSARDQIAAHAAEIKKANPDLTLAQARVQAWEEHPELVVQSREEGGA